MRRSISAAGGVVLSVIFGGLYVSSAFAADAVPAKQALDFPEFQKQIQPFFNKYCIECHTEKGSEPEIQLDKFANQDLLKSGVLTLEKAVAKLRSQTMPPRRKPQPTQQERQAALAWLEAYTSGVDCDDPATRNPGRVTIRRLNRVEYDNTIRDLLAMDFQPAAAFPADSAGYGFDNNGDVLTIAPVLMEKYLKAAVQVLDRALLADPVIPPPLQQWDGPTMEGTIPKSDPKAVSASGRRSMLTGRLFQYGGEIYGDYDFPVDGEYVLRIRGYGRQRPVFQFKLDGVEVGQPITATEDQQNTKIYGPEKMKITKGRHRVTLAFINGATQEEHEAAVVAAAAAAAEAAARAATQPAATMPAEPEVAAAGAGARGARGRGARGAGGRGAAPSTPTGKPALGVNYVEIEGPLEVTPDRMPEAYRRIMVARPSATVTKAQAAEAIIRNFAYKAFRRPVTNEEVQRLMEMWAKYDAEGESFEHSIHTTLQTVLASPNFIYRYERDPSAEEGGVRTIDEYELASRLSYFLWSSTPDDELLALAQKGQLRANLDAQVERMMKDPKVRALVENFAGQWLNLRKMEEVTPDAKTFPQFDDPLRQAMITETEMLFMAIVQENRSILDFIDADFTFVNERLARHYGMIEGVSGEEFRRIQLKTPERGGLLTHASILTITSYPGRTSPVQRGKWVLENLFDQTPPPPPPDVPALQDKGQLKGTLRQRMEQHRENPACASCHEQMDAIGFGLENFDAIGAWRTDDGDSPIDPSGSLPSGESFKGPAELKKIIKAHEGDFSKTLIKKMLTYALGRGMEKSDQCYIDAMSAEVKKQGYKFSVLVNQVVHSDPFQKRAAK